MFRNFRGLQGHSGEYAADGLADTRMGTSYSRRALGNVNDLLLLLWSDELSAAQIDG
jgi:hypothetical protein